MTVLVVDDERYMREEIARLLQALPEAGRLTVHYARDGAQALEQALLTPPDVLLTDVRMPRMDGLSLAEQIRALMPDCRLVFLSNYSDKEYLFKAIRLQAADYIDKPLLAEKLPALMETLWTAHQKKVAERQSSEANAEDARKILSHLWVAMLRNKEANLEAVRAQCARYGLDCFYQAAYRCVFLKSQAEAAALRDGLTAFLERHGVHALPCDSANPNLHIFFLYASGADALCDGLLKRLFQWLRAQSPLRFGMAAGPAVASCQQAYRSYQLAQLAGNRLYYADEPALLLDERPTAASTALSEEKRSAWMDAMLNLNTKAAVQVLDSIFADLHRAPDTPVEDVHAYFGRCAERMLTISSENLLDFHTHHTSADMQRQIKTVWNLRQLEQLMGGWLGELMDCGVGENRIIRTILAYIHRNYQDPSLGLERLCGFTGYSKSYLCRLFQKVVGDKIGSYIIHVRINQACALLEGTKDNLDEIARAVGYDNPKYFGQVFKRHVGMTPLDYRKSRQNES